MAAAAGGQRPALRIGFICGREDEDYVRAPGLPEALWCTAEVGCKAVAAAASLHRILNRLRLRFFRHTHHTHIIALPP